MLHPNEYIAGIHDVMAAELLAASSLTNPGAEEGPDACVTLPGAPA
jgi:hypothetical protein